METLIAILGVLTTLAFAAALAGVIWMDPRRVGGGVRFFLGVAVLIYVFVGVSNVLEHGGVTDLLDRYEDYAEVAFVPFVMFALLGLRAEREQRRRIQADEALGRSEERFRSLVEASSDWIWEIDAEGVFRYASPKVRDLLGYEPAEVMGRAAFDLMPPEEARRVRREFARICEAGAPIVRLENVNITKDGRRVVLETSGVPVFDETGKLTGYRGVDRDITDRKRAEQERRRLEEQVRHTQKLESLGVLAGGIAHDFNNLLVAILGNAELALEDMAPASPGRACVDQIRKAAKRAADLTNQMLAYSGRGRFVIQPMDLNEIVREMSHLVEVSIAKKVDLRYDLAEGLPPVEVDPAQIRQVVMNLVTNASEAIGDESGVVRISTGVLQADRAYLSGTHVGQLLPEGEYAYLEVADTGCGMDEETRRKAFDPFFTTKFAGRGLGMAAVLGIVRGHHGAIRVRGEPGKGSTFTVLLPPGPTGQVRRAPEERPAGAPWRGHGTILVVDDEASVRDTARAILERHGFSVLTAPDGQAGVEAYRRRAGDIAAVLLDMTMPRMNGEEAFRELRRINPQAKVILASGYDEQDATSRFAGAGLAGFVQKPFAIDELIAKVRQVTES